MYYTSVIDSSCTTILGEGDRSKGQRTSFFLILNADLGKLKMYFYFVVKTTISWLCLIVR